MENLNGHFSRLVPLCSPGRRISRSLTVGRSGHFSDGSLTDRQTDLPPLPEGYVPTLPAGISSSGFGVVTAEGLVPRVMHVALVPSLAHGWMDVVSFFSLS